MKMDWSTVDSHGVVVKGYNDYTQLIIVDPAMGCSQIKSYEYDALKCGTQIMFRIWKLLDILLCHVTE